ncbi:TetR/AcrR family transcriptional regulator [Streptomyces sp. NPDC005799]|uniref:TetR/AcrR family transcriptional regulator n=1 Tax=Streptomyces sp. NPDC005799 TaxID=3154678 RepID=UPI003405AB08
MTEVAASRRSRFTAERESALYETVLELLGEVGYDGLTMDAVATRTRTSKATLYRQWGGKVELVVEAMRHKRSGVVADVDTGSLREDFDVLLDRAAESSMEETSSLMRGLAVAMHRHPDLGRVFRERILNVELEAFQRVLRHAVDRGEINADNPALDHAAHMLLGALVARGLLEDLPPTRAFLRAYVDAVVLPVLLAPPPSRNSVTA